MRPTSVWTDPDFAELLAQEPELVAIADAVQQTRAARPARRRRLRVGRLSGAAAAAAAAAIAVVLLVPWNGSGQAAVLQRVRSALTPRPGWVLHERDVTRQVEGANGPPVAVVSESWTRYAAPYPYRELIRRPGSPVVAVTGTATTSGRGSVFHDPAADLRQAVIAGKAAIAGRATYPGRTIYRIVPTTPQHDGLWIAFVDGTTFRPIRFDSSGPIVRGKNGVAHPTTSVTTVTSYEYLPPTTLNLRLAGVRTSHPATRP